jgi:hypothetical protein
MRVWLLALALCACDGLGDPIVSELAPEGVAPPYMCELPRVSCTEPFTPRPLFAQPAAVEPASFCTGFVPTEPCSSAAQGGRCVLALQVVESVPVALPSQRCVTLELRPAAGSERPELRGLSIEASRIRLHAERPTTFVLDQVELRDVALELSGPLDVRIGGQLRNVSITSRDAVRVTLVESAITRLTTQLPAGSLRVQRSPIAESRLSVRELELETTPLADVTIDAARMVGIQLSGRMVRLDVSDLSVSEAELSWLEVHRCDDVLLVDARLSQPQLAACTNKLRANSSALTGGRINGRVESVRTYWNDMHFGAGAVRTTLELWQGTLNGSVLCPSLDRVTLSEETAAACNDCTPLSAPQQHLCRAMLPSSLPAQEEADAGMGVGVLYGGNQLCPILDTALPPCNPQPVLTSPL